jgi:hypothetical protein
MYVQFNNNRSGGGLGCLIMGILALVATYYIVSGIFYLLYKVSPFLLALALIINWRAVADTGKDFLALFQRNPLMAILVGGLAVVAFPLLSLYLFLKALGYNKAEEMRRQFNGGSPFGGQFQPPKPNEEEFVEFEELESTPKAAPKIPAEPPPAPEKPANPYDEMFK